MKLVLSPNGLAPERFSATYGIPGFWLKGPHGTAPQRIAKPTGPCSAATLDHSQWRVEACRTHKLMDTPDVRVSKQFRFGMPSHLTLASARSRPKSKPAGIQGPSLSPGECRIRGSGRGPTKASAWLMDSRLAGGAALGRHPGSPISTIAFSNEIKRPRGPPTAGRRTSAAWIWRRAPTDTGGAQPRWAASRSDFAGTGSGAKPARINARRA